MNDEVLFKLNEDTRKYLTLVFSFIDYLAENDFEVNLYDNENNKIHTSFLDQIDIVSLSCFLATLYTDSPISRIFKNSNVSYERSIEFFKDENFNKNFKIADDIRETVAYDEIDLDKLCNSILTTLMNEYGLEKSEVSLKDIQDWTIFDYMISTYSDVLSDLFRDVYNDNDMHNNEVFANYDAYLDTVIDDFLTNSGIVVINDKDETKEFDFGNIGILYDQGHAYFIVKGKPYIDIHIIHDKDDEKLRIYDMTKINKIFGKKLTSRSLTNFIDNLEESTFCNFTIYDAKDDKIKEFSCYKDEIFDGPLIEDGMIELDNFKFNNNANAKPKATSLEKYGVDLTKKNYPKNPCVGRSEEIDKVQKALMVPFKDSSVMLVGDSGVGKTAIVEGLAYMIQNGTVKASLKDTRIISISTTSLVSGTQYVGTLEKKMEDILKEASKDKNIILFIDEIHQTIGGGSSEKSDNSVAEILKPYLERGDVRVIGATTNDEYIEYVEPNKAFKTRFQKVDIKEPNEEIMYKIIDDLITSYNKVSDAKIKLNDTDRKTLIKGLIIGTKKNFRDYKDRANNPRLLIDIIKMAYANALFDESDEVTLDHILNSFKSCDRLYDSSRKRQSSIISSMLERNKTIKDEKVLDFTKLKRR